MKSIRIRLLSWLLGCVTLVALAAGWGVYRSALIDTDQLFDYQLRQLALAMRDQTSVQAPSPPDEASEIVVQIWDQGGARIYLSHPSTDLPEQATLGFQDVHTGSGDWRVFSIQMRGRTIRVSQPTSVRHELARAHAYRTLLPIAVLLPLLAAALWLGVDRALRPMSIVVREVRSRDSALLMPLSEESLPEEILTLVRALNGLLRRLSAALNAQRAFVSDAAHELRSPLTALSLQLQLLARAPTAEARRAAERQLAAGVERAAHLVNQLLTLARSAPDAAEQAFASVRLDEIARLAVADTAPLAAANGVDLGVAAADEVTLAGDADALRILIRNLADNAVRYTPRGGRVDVSVRRGRSESVLEVADTGPGIPVAERERVFARFYRVQGGDQGGSGLGLAIVKEIAERHAARIEFDDAAGGGLVVRLVFPPKPLKG
jgi:two-component system OmpR family sensor kinase